MKITGNEVDMSMQDLNSRILKILADNAVSNPSPRVMDSDYIAKTLNIELARIQQLLTALHASGLVITNMDSQYSLITEEGMQWLNHRMALTADNSR
jgi:predicted transcriptional regulator